MTPRRNPPNRRNPGKNVGIADDRWERFGEQCERLGSDRTKEINRYISWMIREPGGPKRLLRAPLDDVGDESADDDYAEPDLPVVDDADDDSDGI